jgi:hypothetical protein
MVYGAPKGMVGVRALPTIPFEDARGCGEESDRYRGESPQASIIPATGMIDVVCNLGRS